MPDMPAGQDPATEQVVDKRWSMTADSQIDKAWMTIERKGSQIRFVTIDLSTMEQSPEDLKVIRDALQTIAKRFDRPS